MSNTIKKLNNKIGGVTIEIKKTKEDKNMIYFTAKISRGFLNQEMEFGMGNSLSEIKKTFEEAAVVQVVLHIVDMLDDVEQNPTFQKYLDSNLSILDDFDGFDDEEEITLEEKIESIKSFYEDLKRKVDSLHLIVPKKWNHNPEVHKFLDNFLGKLF